MIAQASANSSQASRSLTTAGLWIKGPLPLSGRRGGRRLVTGWRRTTSGLGATSWGWATGRHARLTTCGRCAGRCLGAMPLTPRAASRQENHWTGRHPTHKTLRSHHVYSFFSPEPPQRKSRWAPTKRGDAIAALVGGVNAKCVINARSAECAAGPPRAGLPPGDRPGSCGSAEARNSGSPKGRRTRGRESPGAPGRSESR
jgi:hypothetical protein